MNWQEYTELAIRTESAPDNYFSALASLKLSYHEQAETDRRATRLLHAALGVCTETAELHDGHTIVNWVEEIGDILWYLAIADSTIGWHEEHYHADLSKPILFYIGEVQDVLKRHIFYGAEVNVVRLGRAFSAILEHCAEELASKSFKLEEAMIANIMKLEKRFPDKFFDAKAAIHRDVDRELEHIGADGKILSVGAEAKSNVAKLQWRNLTSEGGVLITSSWDFMPGPKELQTTVLQLLGLTQSEAVELFGTAITHAQILVVQQPEEYQYKIKVIPYTEEEMQNLADDVADAAIVKERQGQPTVSVSVDDLIQEATTEQLGLSSATIMETFFPLNYVTLSYQGWNDLVKAILTPQQIERMAMDLAFERAKYYRLVGAVGIARGYDAMYAAYSGRGDKLGDFSLAMMWQEAGYPTTEDGIKEKLERWK